MANTTNLGLPLMAAAQSQKHITHNDAILMLDALVQLAVISTTLTAPPGSPVDGDRYIIGSGATGAWAGKDLNVAFYSNGVWQFAVPRPGWQAYDIANNDILVWNGSAWIDVAVAGGYASVSAANVFTGSNTFTDSLFFLRDNADNTKQAQFELSGITTATTRVYTLPNVAGALASLGNLAQTFAGAMTFSNTFVVSAPTSSLGTSTAASTINVGTGATLASTAKTVNIGTGGVATSTTTVNIGSTTAGALGTLNINSPTVTFGATNTAINIAGTTALAGAATTATLLYLGLGGATPDATNRFSINTPAVLFNNAGAGINATVNKAATGNDASFTFQTAFSTRALFGLLADDDFSIKVSPNGSSFFTGLNIRSADGNVGVGGASADANNGLSVSGNLLLNRKTASVSATLNKQATANDAAFTLQTGFSTRALFGLLADDRFTVKTSPDGSTFYTGLVLDANGRLGLGNALPTGTFNAPLHIQDSAIFMPQLLMVSTSNDSSGPYWNSRKARGGTSTNVNDVLGTHIFQGMGTNGFSTNSSYMSAHVTHLGTTWVASNIGFTMTDTGGLSFNALSLLSNKEVRFPSIGTTASAANAFLDANNGLLKSTSSARYKTEVEDLEVEVAYRVLRQARPVWYRSLAEADRKDWSWYGFLAEDVGAADPRLVTWAIPEEDYDICEVESLSAGAAGADMPMRGLVQTPKPGAVAKPDGVMYERFVVMHQRILLDLLERVESLENSLHHVAKV